MSSVCLGVVWVQCFLEGMSNIHWTPPYSTQLRVTLTNDNNKIFKALQAVEPAGRINFVTGVRIAHVS